MNIQDTITYLGQVNATQCYPKRYEEINTKLPYFKLYKSQNAKLDMSCFNYQTHDNAPRMLYVKDYLTRYIFSNLSQQTQSDLQGYYNIQLHDSPTYLNDNINYKGVLTFGKFKDEKGPVMLPDCYFIGDWAGKYTNIQDTFTWDTKNNKVIFAGTTTGSRDPTKNARINTCIWALDKSQCDFYITNIAQMNPVDILSRVPRFKEVYHAPISWEEQKRYKYHLIIDGNTCKWNPDVYFTNSLGFHMPSNDMLWYYPLLQDNHHFVSVDLDTLLDKHQYYENNPQEAQVITNTANKLARSLFTLDSANKYTTALFESIASNK